MDIKSALLIATCLVLSACTDGGYNRSYIISESVEEEVVTESQEIR